MMLGDVGGLYDFFCITLSLVLAPIAETFACLEALPCIDRGWQRPQETSGIKPSKGAVVDQASELFAKFHNALFLHIWVPAYE